MKIAVFGGSFDPIHKEHIQLAKAAIESLGLDKLFVMPANMPPHKPNKILSANEDRLIMCRLAFANVDKVEISDYEIAKGGTSYTYLTCRHFREAYKDAEIYWLVGTDMLRDFPTWKEPKSILQDVTLAVCARAETDGWLEEEQKKFYERFGKKFAVISYNAADVSSTKIRVLAGAGMRLTDFTDEKVAEYIEEKKLYEIPFAFKALSLEKAERQAHSIRVAELAAKKAAQMKISEKQAITAALFHDCAKNLPMDSSYLQGFRLEESWGEVPPSVLHQFTGAYVAEHAFQVKDEAVLNAIRFHTSGRENMSELEKLIFLADMIEPERSYEGVDELRRLFWKNKGLDECLKEALFQTLEFLKEKNKEIYPLTKAAYAYLIREEV